MMGWTADGTTKEKLRRRAGLEREEGDEAGDDEQYTATYEAARARIDLEDRARRAGHEEADTILPTHSVHEHMWWDPEEPRRDGGRWIWKGGGMDQESEEDAMNDPLARVVDRIHEATQEGWAVETPDGTRVALEAGERKVLLSATSAAEDTKAIRPAVALHILTKFTDVWATDGSKGETMRRDGRRETAVAAGAYCGRQPVARRQGEEVTAWRQRQAGAGLRSERLPGHYEVVDAELAAVLMALEETAAKTDASGRRCLIMSDCESAMRMVEAAWRGGRRTYAAGSRGAMLEAICTQREKLQTVITMYVPADEASAESAGAARDGAIGYSAGTGGRSTARAHVRRSSARPADFDYDQNPPKRPRGGGRRGTKRKIEYIEDAETRRGELRHTIRIGQRGIQEIEARHME